MPEHVLESNATIRWLTHPPEGVPRLTVGSRTLAAVPLAIDRAAPHPLATSPGELMAGAVGSVFAWLLSEELVSMHTQAQELVIEVQITADEPPGADHHRPAIQLITCRAEARAPALDGALLQTVSETVSARAIRALGLREDLAVQVETTVVGG